MDDYTETRSQCQHSWSNALLLSYAVLHNLQLFTATAGSVDQSVAPETTASGSQGRLIFQSPHGRRKG